MKWDVRNWSGGQIFEYGFPLLMALLVMLVYGVEDPIPLRLFYAAIVAVLTWTCTALVRWTWVWVSGIFKE